MTSLTAPFQADYRDYDVYSFRQLLSAGWKLENINAQIDSIIGEYRVVDDSEDEWGTSEKWLSIYKETLDTAFAVIKAGNTKKIVAYWHLAPVNYALYERALKGENINSDITIDDLDYFNEAGTYYVYFVDFFTRMSEPSYLMTSLFTESAASFLSEIHKRGCRIASICANLTTPQIVSVCTKLQFRHVCDHQVHRTFEDLKTGQWRPSKIYELKFDKAAKDRLARRRERAVRLWRERTERDYENVRDVELSIRQLLRRSADEVQVPQNVMQAISETYKKTDTHHRENGHQIDANDPVFWDFSDMSHLGQTIEKKENWAIFESAFENIDRFRKHFANVLTVRNGLSHHRVLSLETIESGRTSAQWLLGAVRKQPAD